jgi:hypothetical protein
MATTADGPASGTAQPNNPTQERSSVVTNARNVTSSQGLGGMATEQSEQEQVRFSKVPQTLQGLGNLQVIDPELDVPHEDDDEGEGEWCVVLVDYLSGNKGVGFTKGDVRRVSKLVAGYGDEKRVSEARNNARRIFEGEHVRVATDDEIIKAGAIDPETRKPRGKVQLLTRVTTSDVNILQTQLAQSQRENEEMRRQLDVLREAQRKATPIGQRVGGEDLNQQQF